MIEIRNAVKIYENGAKGLEGVSLNIEAGEFTFLVGSSGSGKSSLMRLLQKEIELTSGKIMVNGQDISKITRKQLPYYRRKMGVVFQDFRLLKNKTVYENVAYAMQIVEATNREIRRAVPQVLALVGLARKAKAYPNQLSGGEQQRTALARAIVNRPPLLLADEPTGNLDPDTAWEIMTLLEDINDRGTTVVVATHAHDIVDYMQKRVIAIKNGVIISDREHGSYGLDEDEYNENEYRNGYDNSGYGSGDYGGGSVPVAPVAQDIQREPMPSQPMPSQPMPSQPRMQSGQPPEPTQNMAPVQNTPQAQNTNNEGSSL